MDTKYDPENVDAALRKVIPMTIYVAPLHSSIVSLLKLQNNERMSLFIVHRRSKVFNFLIVPSHYYCTIGDYEWHPGNYEDPEILLPMSFKNENIAAIEEVCFFCAERRLRSFFERDKTFNFFVNNCQRITGHMTETFIIYFYHAFLIIFIFSNKAGFFFAAIILLATLLLHSIMIQNERPSITFCDHIKAL